MSDLPSGFVLPPRLSLHDALPSGGHARGKPQSAAEGGAPKKGQPWTEEEHRLFLLGLQQLGKGNWRGISRQFVTSRTPTQIASHAQKYSLRTSGVTKRRSRFSALEEQQAQLAAASSQGSSTHAAAQTAASSAQTLPLLASATSAAMLFAWPLLLPPPPQGLQLGMLQGGALAPAPQPPAALSASRSSSTVGPTSQPSSPDSCTATGTSQEQPQHPRQGPQQQQQQLKQRSDGEPRPQHPRRVGVCRPTARLAGRRGSCGGAGASGAAGGQPPEQGGRVATPPTGGAGLQHSASSAFRALVSACGAAATCA